MRSALAVRLIFPVLVLLSSCSLLDRKTVTPVPLPSPPAPWTLELTQSGGIAGVQLSVEVTSDGALTATNERSGRTIQQTLPADTLAQLRKLVAALPDSAVAPGPSSCADCFVYTLVLSSPSRNAKISADDTTMSASGAQELISFLRSLRDAALATQP